MSEACPLCGASDSRLRFRDGPWRVVRCAGCELVHVLPRPTAAELARVYDASYWSSDAPRQRGYADYLGAGRLYRRTFRRRWRTLAARLTPPGSGRPRALDVGCAAGYFLDVLAEAGWSVRGVEPSASAARVAAERHGEAILHGTLADLGPQERFDLITLWDVLEHLPDPVAALRQARARLAPGGTLLVETQDVEAPLARLLGRRWHHYKHAEHLVHFSRKTLTAALRAADLSLVEASRRGAGKFVDGAFLVERSGRIGRWLPRLLAPLSALPAVYVNPGDELIVLAEARG